MFAIYSMNFFSHFFVDFDPNKPAFNAALVAPDILRNFTPNQSKFHFEHFQQITSRDQPKAEPILHDFFNGCLQHIQRDKEFHQSQLFQEIYQSQRSNWQLTCPKFQIPRFWFSLHVVIEIMIDSYLISNNLEKLHLFYNTLESQQETYRKAIELMGHTQIDHFMERYNRFCSHQYLFHYQDLERVGFALHKIHEQVNLDSTWYTPNNDDHRAFWESTYAGVCSVLEKYPLVMNQPI